MKKVFNSDEYIRLFCKNIIEYYNEEIYSFGASFYSYELCIYYLCKYYRIFGKLFEFEQEFLNLLRYSISYSGESGDTGYAYKGLEEVEKNIHILGKDLIIKLLNCFDCNSINYMTAKQLFTIISASNFEEEEKKELKFFYLDARNLEAMISEVIEDNIIFQYNNYVSIGEVESVFEGNLISKTIINKVSKTNSQDSIKFTVKSYKFLKKDFIITKDGQEEYKLITIEYNKDKNLIQLIDKNSEILNLEYKFRNTYVEISSRSEDYNKIKAIIDKKIEMIDKPKIINTDSSDKDNKYEIDQKIIKYDTNELEELIKRLQFSKIIENSLNDAKVLIENCGAPNAIDRMHTALHQYLKMICKDYEDKVNITLPNSPGITNLYKEVSNKIITVQNGNTEKAVDKILKGTINALDEIRNRNSLAHPNELLEEAEARLVIDSIVMILKYLNYKLDKVESTDN